MEKPREQVADAEALLDITNALATSVQAHSSDGLTPADFVSCLLRDFALQGGPSTSADGASNSIRWKDIGLKVSHFLRSAPGCSTMYITSVSFSLSLSSLVKCWCNLVFSLIYSGLDQ